VPNAHPHRFRDSFAVDLLCAGAGVYDVAKMLDDTVETVETLYAPFVPALRERVRRIMESGGGLEATGTKTAQLPAKPMQVFEKMAAGPVSRILLNQFRACNKTLSTGSQRPNVVSPFAIRCGLLSSCPRTIAKV
jgi:hypothetical protein